MLKIAHVDYRQWYSPYLIKALHNLDPNIISTIYLPKYYKETPFSQTKRTIKNSSNNPKVWSSFTYPFDISKKALSDNIDIMHVQWEFNEFGPFYASLLLPLLLLFLRICNKKCVITIHSVIPRQFFGLKLPGFILPKGTNLLIYSGFILLYRLVVLLSNSVIVHGPSLKKLLEDDYKCPSKKIFIVPYGTPNNCFAKSKSKFDPILLDNSKIILSLGAISPRKGLEYLISAFKQISEDFPAWTLVIAGRVPAYYHSYYKHLLVIGSDLIARRRLIFLGEFDTKDTYSIVKKAEIMVFPYIYNFGASSTLTFALQQRKVIIISELNFSKDLLTDGENAILVPTKNTKILAIAIKNAIISGKLKSKIKDGIELLLEKNSWNVAARETLNIYFNSLRKSDK